MFLGLGKRNCFYFLLEIYCPFVEFLVIVFHCSQTTVLSQAFPSYIFPSYWVVPYSYVVVGYRRLSSDYSEGISYPLGFFLLLRFGGIYLAGIHDALWAEDRKQVSSHVG